MIDARTPLDLDCIKMKHTVLVVDDEVDNVDALERLFRQKYNVLKATSGAEALKLMNKSRVSLIVTDQRMPQMTGVEFLMASQKIQQDCMRILLTGYTDIDSVIAAVNSGQIYRYITKPWDPVDLSNTVDQAIERFEMSAELKEKNIALEAALAELKTLDAAKSNFMILINHELKTPLTSLISFLDLLKESELDSDQSKFVLRIDQSVERLRRLIEDSLELVSAETGVAPVKIKSTNITKTVQEVLNKFEFAIAEKELEVEFSNQNESVKADPQVLLGVISRLIDNATKFATKGSTLVIKIEESEPDWLELEIKNSGPTLSKSILEHILKPFALDEDVMHHSKGTGLGLSIARARLKQMKSQLHIESKSGTFSVRFQLPSAG